MNYKDFEYTKKWLEYEILTKDYLEKQIEEFEKGEDDNLEHYRYKAFINWMNRQDVITQENFNNIIEIIEKDSDFSISKAMLFDLKHSDKLNIEQEEKVQTTLMKYL